MVSAARYEQASREEAERRAERERHEAELAARLSEATASSDIEVLKARRAALEAERGQLAAALATAEYRASTALGDETRQAVADARRRARDNEKIANAITASIQRLRRERGAEAAAAFRTSAQVGSAFQRLVESEAAALEPLAVLANLRAAALADGANAASLPPVPSRPLEELRSLVRDLLRAGVKIDASKLPEAVRYLEGR